MTKMDREKNLLYLPDTVDLGEHSLRIRMRKSNRALHYSLRILSPDLLEVVVPSKSRNKNIAALIQRHKKWISRQILRQKKKNSSPPYHIHSGAVLPILGKTLNMELKGSTAPGVKWAVREGTLLVNLRCQDTEHIHAAIIDWYRKEARDFLSARVPFWERIIKVRSQGIIIKNQKTLWGSCSRKGNINFNWRIMLLSPEAADYLIIHELCHLIEMNHSPRFWTIVERFCPDFKNRRKELRNKGHWLNFPPR